MSSSIGFTRDSVAKLMEMLDEQSSKSSIDEKTYLELSNAAKYLYEEAGPQTRPETPPPPPEWDDEVLLPSRQNANRNGYITPPRPVARVLTNPDPHRMFSEREITPEYLKRLVNSHPEYRNRVFRLNYSHKIKALKDKLDEMGVEYEWPRQRGQSQSERTKYLLDICRYYGVEEREIKRIYQLEKYAHIRDELFRYHGITIMNPSLDAYVRERALEREREEYNRVLSTGWSPNADGEDLIAEAQRMASERTA